MSKILINKYFKYAALAALLYMPLFGFLGHLPIRIWDEARLAANAEEMMESGQLIVTTYQGAPEMWNTKPPLLLWMQACSMSVFGINELALRLPSALAGLFTCVLLMAFSVRHLRSFWFGFMAVLVLITTAGYVGEHATRTGDYDAMLTLFTTAAGLSFFVWCESQRARWLYAFFGFMALAVLTKGISGMLFGPALVLYALAQRRLVPLLSTRHFYIGLGGFLLPITGYYLLRESMNPGFLAAVYINELGGRFATVLEENRRGFWFYFDGMVHERFGSWVWFVLPGAALGLASRDARLRRLTLFTVLMSVVYFLVVSTAATKLFWYDVPMYPFLALIVAVGLHFVFDGLTGNAWLKENLRLNVVPWIGLFLVFFSPYEKTIHRTYKPAETTTDQAFYDISYYLRGCLKQDCDLDGYKVVFDYYPEHFLFYTRQLARKDIIVELRGKDQLQAGDRVIVPLSADLDYVESNYDFVLSAKVKEMALGQIAGKNPIENP